MTGTTSNLGYCAQQDYQMINNSLNKQKLKELINIKSESEVMSDFARPWTVVYQAPPCMGFSRQEYWSGLPFPSPGGHPNTEIEPGSPALQTGALPSEPPGKPN